MIPSARTPLTASGLILVTAIVLAAPATQALGQPLPRLHAQGRAIVDADGNPVQLRGVNLGSWLFGENWITNLDYPLHGRAYILGQATADADAITDAIVAVGPGNDADWLTEFHAELSSSIGQDAADAFLQQLEAFPSVWDDSDKLSRQLLEDRFGTTGRDWLLDQLQRSWVRKDDLRWLKEAGFNVVRVPIGYRNLLLNSDHEPLTELRLNPLAFFQLERLVAWCAELGLYAVIDLQESPGGHNDYSGEATLYSDPAMQTLTINLWLELSRRFRHNNAVAAYSLLAEPFGAPSTQARDQMYDRLIDAIRATGDDHLCVLHDGFDGLQTLPHPWRYGWRNVVYSTHFFEFEAQSYAEYFWGALALKPYYRWVQRWHNVPYFIGSFSTMRDEAWAYRAAGLMVDTFEDLGWSWSLWTFKRIDDPIDRALWGTTTSWGLLRPAQDAQLERPDLYGDSYLQLWAKLTAYGEIDWTPNEALLEAIQP